VKADGIAPITSNQVIITILDGHDGAAASGITASVLNNG